jgi:hypothetical protein
MLIDRRCVVRVCLARPVVTVRPEYYFLRVVKQPSFFFYFLRLDKKILKAHWCRPWWHFDGSPKRGRKIPFNHYFPGNVSSPPSKYDMYVHFYYHMYLCLQLVVTLHYGQSIAKDACQGEWKEVKWREMWTERPQNLFRLFLTSHIYRL